MGGSSGGVIIRQSAIEVLTNPTVHGLLPTHMTAALDPILFAGPDVDWTTEEKMVVAHVYGWAIVHL